jgi:hypothetical protein
MMELAKFFFDDLWHFIGLVIVLSILSELLVGVIRALRCS